MLAQRSYPRNRMRETIDDAREYIAEQKDNDENKTEAEEGIVFHPRLPFRVATRQCSGQKRLEHFGAVERRYRNKIEKPQPKIHDDADETDRPKCGIP